MKFQVILFLILLNEADDSDYLRIIKEYTELPFTTSALKFTIITSSHNEK